MATDVSLLKEIGMLQSDYNRLLKSKAFTKKALSELVIPFQPCRSQEMRYLSHRWLKFWKQKILTR